MRDLQIAGKPEPFRISSVIYEDKRDSHVLRAFFADTLET